MKYTCINHKCRFECDGDEVALTYCPVCGWLLAGVEGEEALKTKSRCGHAYLCQSMGEFYDRKCEIGPSAQCHHLIDSLLACIRRDESMKMRLLGEGA